MTADPPTGPVAAPKRKRIQINRRVIGPPAPRPIRTSQLKLEDFPQVSRAHREVARKLSHPLLLGPPVCEELMAVIRHLYTEEEASLVAELGIVRARTAAQVAKAVRRPVDEVAPLLTRMARQVRTLWEDPGKDVPHYRLLPLMPGIFEMVCINPPGVPWSPFQQRFAELFEALYETGYFAGLVRRNAPVVRFLPAGQQALGHQMALPSEKMEVVAERYDTFAIGQCQCRLAMRATGRGCDRTIDNCTAMGEWAESAIRLGVMKRVSRADFLEIKAQAQAEGMVSFLLNMEHAGGQASCSCCGCCCHLMRLVNEFNSPAGIAPPHFRPQIDRSACRHCGKCAKACPMGALVIDAGNKTGWELPHRCIGCGLCATACDKQQAIRMEPVPYYQLPADSWFGFISRTLPAAAGNALSEWLSRKGLIGKR